MYSLLIDKGFPTTVSLRKKVSIFGVILVQIFPERYGDMEYLSIFSPNTGKCGPE